MSERKKRKKRPSMQDVANLAGVSRTTVSFVLNKVIDANIPAETQERVLSAAEELNYRPNAIARGLRAQRTGTFGFISDFISTTPYAGKILQGAQDLAWEHNTLLLSINTSGDSEIRNAAVNMLLERQVDGIVYATMWHREVEPPPAIREVPTVLLDCFVADKSLPSVVPNEVLGGYTATRHLLEKGHRRIAFINDKETVPAHHGRYQGYQNALAEFQVSLDPTLVTQAVSLAQGGYEAARTLLAQEERPTALFCFNDRMAMGAYDAARELGLSIPDDIAIVGFDNQELIAPYLYPSLTTLELPHYEMGWWAVDHLLKLMGQEDRNEAPVQHLLECPLMERESA